MGKRRPAEVHGILCVDKPLGWTSRDVVNKVGHLLGDKRCGHAGTLDPDASGLLLVAFGEAGKAVRWLQDAPKTYETDIALGTSTTTDDAAGEVLQTLPVPDLTDAQVLAALPSPGVLDQVPPQVSALQTDGVRDHQRVRRGEVVVRPARQVWLGGIERLDRTPDSLRLRVTCGAGFYIRSLARDLGQALGTVAHVRTLRRVHNGGFDVAEGVTIEALLALDLDARRERVVPLVDALRRVLPVLHVGAEVALQLRQGKTPSVPGTPTDDAGTPIDGAGTPTDGAGTPTGDAGTPIGDAGRPTGDAGTPTPVRGTPTGDAGTPTDGAGTPTGDAGTPTDGAGTPTDATDTSEVAQVVLVLAEDDDPVCLARVQDGMLKVERGFSTQGRVQPPIGPP